jgi:membrane-bound lytic murein transglycosylase D
MASLASRYDVSVGQLKAWNRTHRNDVRAGQVIVLHVPVGKRVPTEPGPQRLATDVQGGGVQKISTQPAESRYDKKAKGHGKSGVVKVAEPVAAKGKVTKVSASAPAGKASKAAAPSRTKTAAGSKKSK